MRWIPAVLLMCGLLLGCGGDSRPAGPGPEPSGVVAPPPPPPPPPPPSAPPSEDSAPATAEGESARPAEVGVGRKGHGYGTGPIATPLATRWRAEERLIFDAQIPQAMNLFKATNGRAPKSHDEFIKEIIEFNQIRLPELPAGQRYQYDPQAEQLMVVGAQGQ
ncbi:MAG: hypothetical protein U1E05_08840 [Patescibacteria group bacterium]|nr:hypothetical protein [Patescibacteria group bacterium]